MIECERPPTKILGGAVPAALCGALGARFVAADPSVLRGVYAALMLSLAGLLALGPSEEEMQASAAEQCAAEMARVKYPDAGARKEALRLKTEGKTEVKKAQ